MSRAAAESWSGWVGGEEPASRGPFLLLTAPTAIERMCVVLALSIALSVPFLVHDQPQGEASLNPVKALETLSTHGDAVKQVIFAGVYAGAAVLLWRRVPLRLLLFVGAPLLLLTAWCFASAAWTDDVGVALRRCTALGGTVLLGAYLGLRFDVPGFLATMRWVVAIVLIGSFAVALLLPASGLDFEGRLRGVFAHKNALSGFCTVGLLVVSARLMQFDYHNAVGALAEATLGALLIAAMLMAHSSGAVPVLALALPLLPLTRLLSRVDRGGLAFLPVMICAGIAAALFAKDHLSAITTMLGRDDDISGRTLIWQFGFQMFLDRFWTGYGYGVFWEGFNSPGAAFWSVFHLGAPHSHNGYLQLALDVGAVGLGLFTTAALSLVYRLALLVRRGPDTLVCWSVAFLGLFLATNLVETRLWIGNQIDTVLFVYIVTSANLSLCRMTGRPALADLAPMRRDAAASALNRNCNWMEI